MDTKTFLEAALGDEGYFCIWGYRISDERKIQKFYDNLDAAVAAAYNLDAEGYDAYFALGTFEEEGSRKAPNVKQMRSCFFDLDCGPTKDYPTQNDALSSLRDFCKQLNLPKPTIVNSGRGLHVYWTFTKPVPRIEWVPVAERLKSLCLENKMRIDMSVTADAARVLRVPGTHNHKDTPPTEVHIVHDLRAAIDFEVFSDLLGKDDAHIFAAAKRLTAGDTDSMMSALNGSYVSRFKTILIRSLEGTGCAQIAEVAQNQADVDEPLWRAALSIAQHCTDAEKAIHKISEKHPHYNHDDTVAKATAIKGPYLCTRFNDFRPDVCPSCKHWNKIKSPIVLGREVLEAKEEDNVVVTKAMDLPNTPTVTYKIPPYPKPFFRGLAGGIFVKKKVKDEEGETVDKDVLVYHNDLYVTRRLIDPDAGESLVMRLHLPRDGVREFTIPLTCVGAKDELRKQLSYHGVGVTNVTDLMEYIMKFLNDLQFLAEADNAQRQFGWTDETCTAFALGNKMIYADRVEVNAPSVATAKLFPIFTPKGSMEEWKKTMEFFNRPGFELYQFVVGMAFGAPLMELLPINAAVAHLYSKESGVGKTTAMFAGASIWGNPDLMVLNDNDTFNSKMNRAEVYKNLPVYMDEMTNTHPKELSDFAYQIPSGQQRNRMSGQGNAERHRGKPWKTLFCTTGNTGMIERINLYKAMPKAEAQRILELPVSRIDFQTKEETDQFLQAIKNNYGHAGVPYIQYVMKNLEQCRGILEHTQLRMDEAAKLTAENRFWSAETAAAVAGLIIARQANLVPFEPKFPAKFIIERMKDAKERVVNLSGSIEEVISDYLSENYNNMLRIKSTDDARNKAIPELVPGLVEPVSTPRGHLVARYEYDVRKMYLMTKPFREWCTKHQINYNGLVESLKAPPYNAKRVKMRMAKGTHLIIPPTDVLVLDFGEFMTDEAEQTIAANAALFERQAEVSKP